jgi:rhomboid protease GluP
LVATKGFKVARFPEVRPFATTSDYVLFQSNGHALTILCMVDRETYPDEIFRLDLAEVRRIGEACLKYTGTIAGIRMPVLIQIMEVGPGSTEQRHRLRSFKKNFLTARVIVSAATVDTASRQVWSNASSWFGKAAYLAVIETWLAARLQAPAKSKPAAIAAARPSVPLVTAALIALLLAAFASELGFGVGPSTKFLQPTVSTLLALGGLTRVGVLQYGEWYRVLATPFLHLDLLQLAISVIALGIAGWRLESLLGRAWFGAVYLVGALSASLLSLIVNPPSFITVGASGAIMALFAAMMVVSAHFPAGAGRSRLQIRAIWVLTAELLTLTGIPRGQSVDLANLFGGTIGGLLMGLAMLLVWSRQELLPGCRRVAAAMAIAGGVALTYPAVALPRTYQAIAFMTQLIPAEQVPTSVSDMRARAAALMLQYPRDPRPRFLRTVDMLAARDLAGAEREARTALADEDLWRSLMAPQLGNNLRAMLAVAINSDRPEEARSTARPACAVIHDGPMRKMLDDQKLCGN